MTQHKGPRMKEHKVLDKNASFEEPIAMMMLPPIAHYGSNNNLQDMPAEFSGESSRNEGDREDIPVSIHLLKRKGSRGSIITLKKEEDLMLEMEQEKVLKTIGKLSNLSRSNSLSSIQSPSSGQSMHRQVQHIQHDYDYKPRLRKQASAIEFNFKPDTKGHSRQNSLSRQQPLPEGTEARGYSRESTRQPHLSEFDLRQQLESQNSRRQELQSQNSRFSINGSGSVVSGRSDAEKPKRKKQNASFNINGSISALNQHSGPSDIEDSPIDADVDIKNYTRKKQKVARSFTLPNPSRFVQKLSLIRRSHQRSSLRSERSVGRMRSVKRDVKIVDGRVDTEEVARSLMFDIPEDRPVTPVLARTIHFDFIIPEKIVPVEARNFVLDFPENDLKRTDDGEMVYELDELEGKLLQDCHKHTYLRRSKTEPDSLNLDLERETTEFGNTVFRRRDTVALLTDLNSIDNKDEKYEAFEDFVIRRNEKGHIQERLRSAKEARVEVMPDVSSDICRSATPPALLPLPQELLGAKLYNQIDGEVKRLIKTPDAKKNNGFGDIDGLGEGLEVEVGVRNGLSNGFGDGLSNGFGDGLSNGFRYGICESLPDTPPPTPAALHAELKDLTASIPAPEPQLLRLLSPDLCSIMTPIPEVLPEIVVSSSIASTYLPSTHSRTTMNPSAMSKYREAQRTPSSCSDDVIRTVSDVIQCSLDSALMTSDEGSEIREVSHKLVLDILMNARRDILASPDVTISDESYSLACKLMIANVIFNAKLDLLEKYGCIVEDVEDGMRPDLWTCTPMTMRSMTPEQDHKLTAEESHRSTPAMDEDKISKLMFSLEKKQTSLTPEIDLQSVDLIERVLTKVTIDLNREYQDLIDEVCVDYSDNDFESEMSISPCPHRNVIRERSMVLIKLVLENATVTLKDEYILAECHEEVYEKIISPEVEKIETPEVYKKSVSPPRSPSDHSASPAYSTDSFASVCSSVTPDHVRETCHNLVINVLANARKGVLFDIIQRDRKDAYNMCEVIIRDSLDTKLSEITQRPVIVRVQTPWEGREISITPEPTAVKYIDDADLHLICTNLVTEVLISEKSTLGQESTLLHDMCGLLVDEMIVGFKSPELSYEDDEWEDEESDHFESEEEEEEDQEKLYAASHELIIKVLQSAKRDVLLEFEHQQNYEMCMEVLNDYLDNVRTPEPEPCSFTRARTSPIQVFFSYRTTAGDIKEPQEAMPFSVQSYLISPKLDTIQKHLLINVENREEMCSRLSSPTPSPPPTPADPTPSPQLPTPAQLTAELTAFFSTNEKEVTLLAPDQTELTTPDSASSGYTPASAASGYSAASEGCTPFSDDDSDAGDYGGDTSEEDEESPPPIAVLTPVDEEPEVRIAFKEKTPTPEPITAPLDPTPEPKELTPEPSPEPTPEPTPQPEVMFERRVIPEMSPTPESDSPQSLHPAFSPLPPARAYTILVASSRESTIVEPVKPPQIHPNTMNLIKMRLMKRKQSTPNRVKLEPVTTPYNGINTIKDKLADRELLERSSFRITDYVNYRRKLARVTSGARTPSSVDRIKLDNADNIYLRGVTRIIAPAEPEPTPVPTSESSESAQSEEEEEELDEGLEKILYEIKNITNGNIMELKKYRVPPMEIHDVIKAVYLILGEDPEKLQYWQECVIHLSKLGRKHIRRRILRYKRRKVTQELRDDVASILEGYTSFNIALKSRVCVLFFIWAKEVCGLNSVAAENPILPMVMSRFAERGVWQKAGRGDQQMISKAVNAFKAGAGIKTSQTTLTSRESSAVRSTM